jgi:hypothetical protein
MTVPGQLTITTEMFIKTHVSHTRGILSAELVQRGISDGHIGEKLELPPEFELSYLRNRIAEMAATHGSGIGRLLH